MFPWCSTIWTCKQNTYFHILSRNQTVLDHQRSEWPFSHVTNQLAYICIRNDRNISLIRIWKYTTKMTAILETEWRWNVNLGSYIVFSSQHSYFYTLILIQTKEKEIKTNESETYVSDICFKHYTNWKLNVNFHQFRFLNLSIVITPHCS